jgi:hypothetical protein
LGEAPETPNIERNFFKKSFPQGFSGVLAGLSKEKNYMASDPVIMKPIQLAP